MMAYRFSYNSSDAWGFGTQIKQVFVTNSDGTNPHWTNISSGNQLNFDYLGQPQSGSDPVFQVYLTTMSSTYWPNHMEFGGGEVRWDPNRQWWLWIYTSPAGNAMWQKSDTLKNPSWSPAKMVDISPVYGNQVGGAPGVWWGKISGSGPRWWAYFSKQDPGCTFPASGQYLVPATLNYCTAQGVCSF